MIDALGAGISSILLGVVLPKFQAFFGIPKTILYFLGTIPVFFILYDFIGYSKTEESLGFWLKGIAFLNIAYCFVSLICVFLHKETLTFWGWIYIIGEILIVLLLVIIELKVSIEIINQNTSDGKES